MSATEKIRVLLADDHPLVVDGIKGILETYDHISVVAVAANGEQALEKMETCNPDVVLMDLNMPGLNGLAATEMMLEKQSTAKILILSMHDSPEYVSTALRHGARGYVLKDVPTSEIVVAIEAVHAGEKYLCSAIEKVMVSDTGRSQLTSREQTVLLELASGKSNKDVALALSISVRTVETHRKNIKRKLGISSTAGLTRYALENGVLRA